jgi:hypothetical protein
VTCPLGEPRATRVLSRTGGRYFGNIPATDGRGIGKCNVSRVRRRKPLRKSARRQYLVFLLIRTDSALSCLPSSTSLYPVSFLLQFPLPWANSRCFDNLVHISYLPKFGCNYAFLSPSLPSGAAPAVTKRWRPCHPLSHGRDTRTATVPPSPPFGATPKRSPRWLLSHPTDAPPGRPKDSDRACG